MQGQQLSFEPVTRKRNDPPPKVVRVSVSSNRYDGTKSNRAEQIYFHIGFIKTIGQKPLQRAGSIRSQLRKNTNTMDQIYRFPTKWETKRKKVGGHSKNNFSSYGLVPQAAKDRGSDHPG